MCSQHNVRASAEDNTEQNTNKGHTPNPRKEVKIPDPAENRTRAAGLEGIDSTDHATATDILITPCDLTLFLICLFKMRKMNCYCWVLRHFLTSYVISLASDIEREKSDKFYSEAIIHGRLVR